MRIQLASRIGPARLDSPGRARVLIRMPFIEVKVAGSLTREQKSRIADRITQVMQEEAGKPPEATYIVIEEVSRENWAKSGRLLADS